VQSAREAGRRTQCTNNQHQIALALHTYHDANGRFPHGTYNYVDSTFNTPAPYNNMQDRRCWMHDIWPYLEQKPLSEKFELHMQTNPSALAFPLLHTIIPSAMCPSDEVSPKLHTFWGGLGGAATPTQGFSGNYVACAGSTFSKPGTGSSVDSAGPRVNGVIFALSRIQMGAITDGSSWTFLVGEIILSRDINGHDIRGRYHNPAHGGVLFTSRFTPNNMVPDQFNWCHEPRPARRAPCIYTGNDIFLSVRSYHPTGVNMAMCDASVRFIRDSVDLATFRAQGSRNGGEGTTQ
jgi:hypothetical protein